MCLQLLIYRLYFHFRIVGPACVFSCGKKNKVCISTHKHHAIILCYWSGIPSSPPSLHLCSPSQTVFAQSTLAQWRELSFASLDSRTKRSWYIRTSHARTVYILSLIRLYTIITKNIFPTPATCSIFHSFLALMSCTSTQTCPCMYLTASDVCWQELRSTVKVVHKHLSMHTCIVSNIVYPCSPACSMVSAPWPTWWGLAFARTSPAVSPTL